MVRTHKRSLQLEGGWWRVCVVVAGGSSRWLRGWVTVHIGSRLQAESALEEAMRRAGGIEHAAPACRLAGALHGPSYTAGASPYTLNLVLS